MDTQQIDEKAVFNAARRMTDAAARDEFLAQACGDDQPAIERIRELLRIHEQEQSFLEYPPAELAATAAMPVVTESPGTVIGPYKLLQQIGEGGMGVVFMAEQTEPIQRTVALKIIKPGMDTRQVIARFEAERQALAMMDHPNIARVLDAGTTNVDRSLRERNDGSRSEPPTIDPGRPYFVMDLVKGVPITDYCDQQQLPVRARLELMATVCQAVQHAHQKGIIHRDLKPSNVLVAEYDGRPVPKIIDFGVAKATAQRLTEKTMFTELGQMVGTVEYMSPEQARFNQLDVDTRSDIYSLGVLLYELLAGSTPFGRKRLNEAAFDEMLRIIREEEPPKPSTRLSSSDALPSIAANRSLEPLKLNRLVQGELDWIVMKALEKDRSRRYETASSFAADIERHLHDEPVEAGPPSAGYRFRKFAKRNKVALAIAALAMFFLIVLGGGVGWSIYDRTARQARVTGQLETILDEVSRLERAEKWSEALTTARRAEPALAAGEAALEIQGRVREALADLELVQRLDEIRAQSGTVWGMHALSLNPADQDYAAAFREAGIDVDALPVKESAERITARRPIAAAVLPALDDWVAVRSVGKNEPEIRRLVGLLQAADPDTWRQRMRDALARKDWPALDNLLKSTDLDRQPAATLTFLCAALQAKGNYPDELLILRRAQWKYPADYWINIRLGTHLIWAKSPNDIRDGIGYTRAAAALRPQSAHPVMILGVGYNNLGQYDEAIACYRKAIELAPNHSTSYTNLGNTLGKKGLHEEAIAAYEQAITLAPQNDSLADHNMTLANGNLAWLLANSVDVQRRDPDKAVRIAKQLVEQFPNDCRNWTALGLALYRSGDWQGAIDALKKSEEIPPVRFESCVNALLLAMAHWQLSEQDEARRWYGKAVEWMEKHQAEDETLRRFQEEAEELLKITDEEPTAKPPVEVK